MREGTAAQNGRGFFSPTVRAVWVSDAETQRETENARSDEDALLRAMLIPGQSFADLAKACGWRTSTSDP